ncbi:Fur family transcriptional regulator [Acuticoccus mangrovi]|uniref:Ferric uptake regulation protein n=1 Tax=Acuticoccus mangrovi TaxID=2796142 RepID=A0A934ISZ0_9HYPH|nr:Fur family transcriptional regulator [Acuticoccus mangrovi]MBJ3778058.1 transcriptional repressor [Acuticoccus mangrovi]
MSEVQRSILEYLWRRGQPVGAYGLMRELKGTLTRQLSPPTVYRALEFLQKEGLVARIETKNAFVACARPHRNRAYVYFICDTCGASVEIESAEIEAQVAHDAAFLGFRIGRRVIELEGTCADCLSREAANAGC